MQTVQLATTVSTTIHCCIAVQLSLIILIYTVCISTPTIEQQLKKTNWQDILQPYTKRSNAFGVKQLLNTIVPYIALWYLYIATLGISVFLVIPFSIVMSLFVLRCFVLMHDCGHGSLFSSNRANKVIGYLLGVITGMPQYVWSKHHAYHHRTNGDWEKYRGPLNIISTREYAELNDKKQRNYRLFRHIAIAPIAGFFYILFNPRFNWIMGSLKLIFDIARSMVFQSNADTLKVIKECNSKYWKTPKEFLHMTYNNIALLSLWYVMCSFIGVFNFFIVYTIALSLAGGLGLIAFTAQHNFENSYASDTAHVEYYRAALEGTSYMKLPSFLNWFTADIAYHHIHHLSTAIPNYRLASCHGDLKNLFTQVKRITLSEIPKSMKYILWDRNREKIVSVAEYHQFQILDADRVFESLPSQISEVGVQHLPPPAA